MKYYRLKYVDELPKGFAGWSNFFNIKIKKGYEDDLGLLEHEKVHVKDWWTITAGVGLIGSWLASLHEPLGLGVIVAAPFIQGILYSRFEAYRWHLEVKAYRKQIETYGNHDYEFAVRMLMNNYGFDVTREEAEEAVDP